MPAGHPETTNPLSPTALTVLASLLSAPVPRQEVNHGVRARLFFEKLVEEVELPSPYRTKKGKVLHLQITPAGQEALTRAKASPTTPAGAKERS